MQITLKNALHLLNQLSNMERVTLTIFKQELLLQKHSSASSEQKSAPFTYPFLQTFSKLITDLEDAIKNANNQQSISKLSDNLTLSNLSIENIENKAEETFKALCKAVEDSTDNSNSSNQKLFSVEKIQKSTSALENLYNNLMELIITEHEFIQSCQDTSKKQQKLVELYKKARKNDIPPEKMRNISSTFQSMLSLSNMKNFLEANTNKQIKFSKSISSFIQFIHDSLEGNGFKESFQKKLIPAVLIYENRISPIITDLNTANQSENSLFSVEEKQLITQFANNLAKPFQRICKYPLLILEISKKIDACIDLDLFTKTKNLILFEKNSPSSIDETIHFLSESMKKLANECNQKMNEITKETEGNEFCINFTEHHPENNSALMQAILSQNETQVIFNLKKGARAPLDKGYEDPTTNSALITAASIGFYEGLATMITFLDDLTPHHKELAMIAAAKFGHPRIVLFIIANISQAEDSTDNNNSKPSKAIQHAIRVAAEHNQADVLNLLLNTLGYYDEDHRALYSSAQYNKIKSCEILLRHEANTLLEAVINRKNNGDILLEKIKKYHSLFFDCIADAFLKKLNKQQLTEDQVSRLETWILDKNSLINQLIKPPERQDDKFLNQLLTSKVNKSGIFQSNFSKSNSHKTIEVLKEKTQKIKSTFKKIQTHSKQNA